MKYLLIIIIITFNNGLFAQVDYTSHISKLLKAENFHIKEGEIMENDPLNAANQIIAYANTLKNDERLGKTLNLLFWVTVASKNELAKQKAVEYFTTYLFHKNDDISAIVDNNLRKYKVSNYNQTARNNIKLMLSEDPKYSYYFREYLIFIAKLDIKEAIPVLQKKLSKMGSDTIKSIYDSKWWFNVVLAHLGDRKAEVFCLSYIQAHLHEKDKFRKFIRDLGTINTINSNKLLMTLLDNNNFLYGNKSSSLREETISEIVANQLIKNIKNVPEEYKDKYKISGEVLQKFRTWIKAQPIESLQLE